MVGIDRILDEMERKGHLVDFVSLDQSVVKLCCVPSPEKLEPLATQRAAFKSYICLSYY